MIIGGGPSGISAAIYAARSGLKTCVFESKIPGGLLNYTNEVRNYPGFKSISGPEMASKLYEHMREYDIDFKAEEVVDLIDGKEKKIVTNKGEYLGKTVIIASGRVRRSLNLPNENELRGNGISYCALCDGNFFKDKEVGVVGAGDSSLEEALYLANICKKVYIIVRSNVLKGSHELVMRIKNSSKIQILYEKNVKELCSQDGRLEGVVLDDGIKLPICGLFVYIGFDPILPFKSDIGIKKDNGYIVVDEDCKTNIEGIYAVGDIIKKKLYQIISAECEGAVAATAIMRELTKKN